MTESSSKERRPSSWWAWLTDKKIRTRLLVVCITVAMSIYTVNQGITGDWGAVFISSFGMVLLLSMAFITPLHTRILKRDFDISHTFYLAIFWVTSQLWWWAFGTLQTLPVSGKDSINYYIFLLLLIALTGRLILSLVALSPWGYDIFFSRIPLWEKTVVAVNEFVAAGLLSLVLGQQIARLLQPEVITLQVDGLYTGGLLLTTTIYYVVMQVMWLRRWNAWLSQNRVWVRLARFIAPLALVVASVVIAKHFTRLSDPRSANLLGTANIDQTILALSPIIWLMVFYVCALVFTGSRGLRRRFLPEGLLAHLPTRVRNFLSTISDMDLLLVMGFLSLSIPLQLFVFRDASSSGVIDALRQQISQNAIIDTSEQALALLFALPFYVLALSLLVLYAYVMSRPNVSAAERDSLVDKLPITLLIVFIITLYMAAIPFSQVLSQGRIPRLPQELGYVLAFNVLIPLILLYFHYFLFIRLPYRRGQTVWRTRHAVELEAALNTIERKIETLQRRIDESQTAWTSGVNLRDDEAARFDMLYDLIDLNGERDRLNMERLRLVRERQELAEISETPVSLTVARLPARVFSFGIPLVLMFKIYEWAIVNDGLREVANNPNIGVFEFFQTVLENTNF